jgi:hypothetical protein
MKHIFLLSFIIPMFTFAQFGNKWSEPIGWTLHSTVSQIENRELTADPVMIEKLSNTEHVSYLCATAINTDILFSDFQLAELMPNGDKIYRLAIHSEGAQGMMLGFENFVLLPGARLWLYDVNKKNYIGEYAARDNYTDDKSFMTSHVRGSTIIVEYLEPKNISTPNFRISKVYHYFRGLKSIDGTGFGASGACMLNANCSEGNGREDANAATCKIKVTTPNSSGFCTGTLLNNTSEDKTPYIITANHCSANSSLADLINWEFYFLYQSSGCSNPLSEPISLDFKGCTAPAYSGSDNGENSSDFLFLKLKSDLPTNLYDFTFLGWDRSNINFANNFCFHHPSGDIKKVSRTLGATIITSYTGNVENTHFQVNWASTTHGQSVTEGGSSGSGLINNNGHLIGTLTGGSSLCTARNAPDLFGRLFMHWDKYGTAADRRVAPWLDPLNTGVTSLRTTKSSGATGAIQAIDMEKWVNMTIDNNQLMISYPMQKFSTTIYNSLGQSVYNSTANSQKTSIDMSSYSKGIYLIEINNGRSKLVKKLAW